MPWSETTPVRERLRFVLDVEEGIFSVSELCARYGISRKTGYKFLARYAREGCDGLKDQLRIARECPHRTNARICEWIADFRRHHPHWGPKKLISRLQLLHPQIQWPAVSTAGDILKRAGLVEPRRRARRVHPCLPGTLTRAVAPNDLWSTDFKGQFRTRDGHYCFPLTVCDSASRCVLEVRALDSTRSAPARAVFQRLFQEYGLPKAIRSDNGVPFASTGLGGLSRLSVWWTRLGIVHQRIAPAHPEQNGSHERMHRTLKATTTRPPEKTRTAQQHRFDRFRAEFNTQRPHEALGQKTPASLYRSSPRSYPRQLPPLHYPGHFEGRRVGSNGCALWKGSPLPLSRALTGQDVGFEEVDDQIWSVYFGPLLLARLHQPSRTLHHGRPR